MQNYSSRYNWIQVLLCVLLGALLTFGFAPYHYSVLAIIAFVGLGYQLLNCPPSTAFTRAYGFGLGLFGVGVWWIYIAVRFFGNAAPILAFLLTLLLILYLALFPGLVGYALARLLPKPSAKKLLIAFPCAWTLSEFLRGWLMSGFPWLFVGYTQSTSTLNSFAPITGVYGLSFITVFCGGALALSLFKPLRRSLSFYLVIFVLLLALLLKTISWSTSNHKMLDVSLIQGNVKMEFKWDPTRAIDNINTYTTLTEQVSNSDFIVWPESSFSLSQLNGRLLLDKINHLAKSKNTTISVGMPYINTRGQFHNALMLLGQSSGRYFKRHLVPFGEFTPFEAILKPLLSWLQIPMSQLTEGSQNQPLLTVNGIVIAPYICYEIVYPSIVNRDVPQAQILLTISEDAWYGDSNAVAQHLEMARMRSLESGRYSLFAVNTGISAIIDHNGKIVQSLGMNKRGILSSKVPAMVGATPWAILGDGPWLLLMAFALFLVAKPFALRNPIGSLNRLKNHS